MNQKLDQRLMITALVALAVYLWLNITLRSNPAASQAGLERAAMLVAGAIAVICAYTVFMRRRRRL